MPLPGQACCLERQWQRRQRSSGSSFGAGDTFFNHVPTMTHVMPTEQLHMSLGGVLHQ